MARNRNRKIKIKQQRVEVEIPVIVHTSMDMSSMRGALCCILDDRMPKDMLKAFRKHRIDGASELVDDMADEAVIRHYKAVLAAVLAQPPMLVNVDDRDDLHEAIGFIASEYPYDYSMPKTLRAVIDPVLVPVYAELQPLLDAYVVDQKKREAKRDAERAGDAVKMLKRLGYTVQKPTSAAPAKAK